MLQVGVAPAVTVLLQLLVQPLAFVMVTEYTPAEVIVMQLVVAPVFQE